MFCAQNVDAHGIGLQLEQQTGSYLIDIGTNVPMLRPGEPVNFNFQLWSNSTDYWSALPFTQIKLTIDRDGSRELDTVVTPQAAGWTNFTHTFAERGTYTMRAEYLDGKRSIISATFILPVEPPTSIQRLFFLGSMAFEVSMFFITIILITIVLYQHFSQKKR